MTAAMDLYGLCLDGDRLWAEIGALRHEVPVRHWRREEMPGDRALLERCDGPTLDVGCGPGRLTVALTGRGRPALGIDLSPAAVELARSRGASVLRRDVFERLPREGHWRHILLADGNIGIGGDPVRLLDRCRRLLSDGGSVLLDLAAEGHSIRTDQVRLFTEGQASEPFPWSRVPVAALEPLAACTGFEVTGVWRAARRWQAELRTTRRWEAPGA